MKKLNLTLALALVSLLSYGQVIQNENETETQEEEKSGVMDAIRPPVDGTYKKIHIPHYKPIPLPDVREADVHWSQLIWRVIDLREKFNFPLYYPTETKGNWKSLMQAILDAMESENTTPLRIYSDEYVNVPKSATEVIESLGQTKQIPKFNPETWEEEGFEEIFIPFGPKEVFRYVIKEQWRLDKQRSVMDQEIMVFCPMFWFEKDGSSGDEEGGENYGSGDTDMGNDDFDDDMPTMPTRRWREFGFIWYPELRPTLATTEVFNAANNAQRRNYDDIFLQRRFNSFISAEENVHDNRQINQYHLNGMDQTLESEKIKERIRVKEHDMWEY